ncbi:MAG: hypothetical protein JXR96_12650 [Deltaproteobacteria bacterium]|nr:hypothetical protein [Deltaproteobacteria bacterium]
MEWVGGILSMPAYVTGEGEPYRPEVLFWMGADGAALGSTIARPGELLGQACGSLQATIRQPMIGRPHAPSRVRVASPELAETLRAGMPSIEVVCAPTPEVDGFFEDMREFLSERAEDKQSYLSPDIGPGAIASLFRAAAKLFRARPWEVVPSDTDLFSVTIEDLGLEEAVVSVIGQMRESLGFIVFSGFDDFRAYLEMAHAMEYGEEGQVPPHVVLNFDRGEDLAPGLREEIVEHKWKVAAENAYPWLIAMDDDMVARPPSAREVAMAEAVSLALAKVVSDKRAVRAAFVSGETLSRTVSVRTHGGNVEVKLRAPYKFADVMRRPEDELLAALYDLARSGGGIDPDALEPLEDELVRRFEASPEAKGLSDTDACRHVMDFASDYFNQTIATLDPSDLHAILFELIPRKVCIDASEAGWIIEGNRAFYAFLKRAYQLEQADDCLSVLGGDAVQELEAALSDSSNFGMAKSFMMAGLEAGYDMQTTEGIEAWRRAYNSQLPSPPRAASPERPKQASKKPAAEAKAKKKTKRKAARKSRKKKR